MKKISLIIITVIAIIAIGGGAFYGGMRYGESKTTKGSSQQQRSRSISGTGGPMNGNSGNMGRGGFTAGEIISKDDKSITIKLQDGGSKIIFYSDTTDVSKIVSGTQSDLEIGKTVTVTGTANQDGSITAQSISIRPVAPVTP